jgi:hypothetical protein
MMYDKNKPKKMVSLPFNTNFLGSDCSRETINLKTTLNTAISENTNTKRYIVFMFVILRSFFRF